MAHSSWEKFYKSLSLEEIPWQTTQADWFKELVDEGRIKGGTAIDLGCGTAKKSIYLVKHGGFKKVVGLDISSTAIEYAKQNVKNAGLVDTRIELYVEDATELSFLGKRKFDFVLDWAMLHGLPPGKRKSYVRGVYQHTHKESLLLLRVFSKLGTDLDYFQAKPDTDLKIYLFDKAMIENLYGSYFQILETNTSKPRTQTDFYFNEYLMQRI